MQTVMNKHVPMRTCVICRTTRPKKVLLRHVCPDNGSAALKPDLKGSERGRGFYACPDRDCADKIERFRGWIHKCKGVL